jgi:hypothetical protein
MELGIPGAGRSSVPWVPLPLRKVARVVEEMLCRLGFAEVDVLGIMGRRPGAGICPALSAPRQND